jgi:hypothetical protein
MPHRFTSNRNKPVDRQNRSALIEPLEERRLCSRTPALLLSDIAQNEAQGTATFTVTLTQPSSKSVRVDFATAQNGSAVAGEDYLAMAGTLVFNPRETIKRVTVLLIDDAVVEPNETFSLKLSSARNASIGIASAVCTILNDDVIAPPPTDPPTSDPSDGDIYGYDSGNYDWGYNPYAPSCACYP